MFRAVLVLVSLMVSGASFVIIRQSGANFGLGLVILNVIVVIGCILLERARYKPLLDRPPAGEWIDTGERSIDPKSGRLVSVYYHPPTGERQYVGGRPPGLR